MGWLLALGVIVVLAILPLGASVIYDAEGPLVRLIAGPARIQVFPMKKKTSQDKKKKEKTPKEEKTKEKTPKPAKEEKPAPPPEPGEKGGSVLDFLPLVDVVLDFLGDFRRKLRVNHLKLHLTMAADDPCDLAVNYGRANAAMAALLSRLDALFVIKKQDVHIGCDFTASETVILARLDLTITVARLLSLLVCTGIRALTTFLKIQKKRKGGANL